MKRHFGRGYCYTRIYESRAQWRVESKFVEDGKDMKEKLDDFCFREVGKGFIVCRTEEIFGRILTKKYVDQNKKTYVKIGGEYIPLTEQHNYLPV